MSRRELDSRPNVGPSPPDVMCGKGSPEFDTLKDELIWNARLRRTRSPQLIAQPRTAIDVSRWIRWAAAQDFKVSLRGSGHNYEAAALSDGGLLLDLGGLDWIEVEPIGMTCSVGAGVTGSRLIKALAQYGLAFPIGHCGDVALSGFILSGGIGWNYGQWGPACANITGAEVVTSNGDLLRVDNNSHPELFWAVCGAGCKFFGAVTGYELSLHHAPQIMVAIETVFDVASAAVVAAWLHAAAPTAHETVEIICMVGPDPHSGTPSVTLRAISSGETQNQALTKLGNLSEPPASAQIITPTEVRKLEFADLPQYSAMPSGKRVAADQIWSEASPADILLAVQDLAHVPSKSSTISITFLGGSSTMPLPLAGSTAFSRSGATSVGIYALWDDDAEDRRHFDWVNDVDVAVARFRSARYIGEANLTVSPDRLNDCFDDESLTRLKNLQREFDPDQRFYSSVL